MLWFLRPYCVDGRLPRGLVAHLHLGGHLHAIFVSRGGRRDFCQGLYLLNSHALLALWSELRCCVYGFLLSGYVWPRSIVRSTQVFAQLKLRRHLSLVEVLNQILSARSLLGHSAQVEIYTLWWVVRSHYSRLGSRLNRVLAGICENVLIFGTSRGLILMALRPTTKDSSIIKQGQARIRLWQGALVHESGEEPSKKVALLGLINGWPERNS